MAIPSNSMLDTSIFDDLQKKIDEDVAVKDVSFPNQSLEVTPTDRANPPIQALRDIVQTLEKQGIFTLIFRYCHPSRWPQLIIVAHKTAPPKPSSHEPTPRPLRSVSRNHDYSETYRC